MTDRKSLLREAYAACRRHAEDRQKAESYVIDLQMERAELQHDLADALGMLAKHDDVPSFEKMLVRIRELRLTLRRRDEGRSLSDREDGRTLGRTEERAAIIRMLRDELVAFEQENLGLSAQGKWVAEREELIERIEARPALGHQSFP